ncbi:hypothetical protein L596_001125 [Steinernema carpocapsae]|uniref:Uncharacterized protein n=1 Tax=Steinernema carpocapsae TaxID=34508 RepID=A0A4U8UMR2_STECR|nr:hypothetical protein L596_001125 [Steinernema carpocapsae]
MSVRIRLTAIGFTEQDLSPRFIPQIPMTLLNSVFVSRTDGTARTPGEEVSLMGNKEFTFGSVASVQFDYQFVPGQGGYLHVLTAIEPKNMPSALFLVYNVPSQGNQMLDLSYPNRQLAVVVGNETIPSSESYRVQYVVMAYRTENVIQNPMAELLDSKGDISALLTNSTCGRELGPPIAGSVLWVTARSTIFPIKPELPTPSPWKAAPQHTSAVTFTVISVAIYLVQM